MSFPVFRNHAEWDVVTTSGMNVLATNRRTAKTFSGTLTAFNEMMNDVLEGTGLIDQSSVPVGIAPTGAVAANGALTLGTALPATYSSGIWLYLPAAAAYTLSPAGIYWCVMTSTTEGTIYNNLLTGVPTIPTSLTAIVDARGSTAYTGATTEVALITVAVPGGVVGANGSIKMDFEGSHLSSAGAKTYVIKGGAATWLSSAATTTACARYMPIVRNEGSAAVNVSTGVTAMGLGARTVLLTAVDTSANFNITFNGTLAVDTDYMLYEGFSVQIQPKN